MSHAMVVRCSWWPGHSTDHSNWHRHPVDLPSYRGAHDGQVGSLQLLHPLSVWQWRISFPRLLSKLQKTGCRSIWCKSLLHFCLCLCLCFVFVFVLLSSWAMVLRPAFLSGSDVSLQPTSVFSPLQLNSVESSNVVLATWTADRGVELGRGGDVSARPSIRITLAS